MQGTYIVCIITKGVFTWRRAGPLGRASPLCRDPASQLHSLSNFVFVYMRGGPEIFHINTLKRAGPPRRASKSKLRTHDKGCLDQHFLDNFSFHKLGFWVLSENKCS